MRSILFNVAYFLVFCLFFASGVFLVKNSGGFTETSKLANIPSRDPAAIKKVYDFSNLDGSALDQAFKQRLVSGAKIIQEANDIGIELGHFVLKGENGEKSFACQIYSRIVLVFEGEGMATSGEKPAMEVDGDCMISANDINSISPLWVPVSRILGEPVAEGDFDYRDGRPAKVHFSHVRDEWPTLWRLKSVRLSNAQQVGSEVVIEDQELRQLNPKPIVIQFR